jgi:hypothetical protein
VNTKNVSGKCACGSSVLVLSEIKSQSGDLIRDGYAKVGCNICGRSTPFRQCGSPNWSNYLKDEWKEITERQESAVKIRLVKVPSVIRNVLYQDVVQHKDRYTGEVSETVVRETKGTEIVSEVLADPMETIAVSIHPEPVVRRRIVKG